MTKTGEASRAEGLQREVAEQLLERARTEGVSLVGPGGLLSRVTKTVLETALDAGDVRAPGLRAARAGRRGQQPQRLPRQDRAHRRRPGGGRGCPRDPAGSFEPKLVRKRQRRLTGVDDLVISRWWPRG